ncbi:MAG: hypothetical protein KDB10_05055 [Acidimicrobiales bacterium]|nr:hypothetical protein [Acidimicrobiales bacterium]
MAVVRPVVRAMEMLLGAVVLGVATLFQPKHRPDDHWSASPKIQVLRESGSESSGGPPPTGDDR